MVPFDELRELRDIKEYKNENTVITNQEMMGKNWTTTPVPILIVPEYFVIASAESRGYDHRKVYKESRKGREADASQTVRPRPTSPLPGWPIWTDVRAFATHNIPTQTASSVFVAMLYTASMPEPKPTRGGPYPNDSLQALENQVYEDIQGFYTDYFLIPQDGERYVLIEIYKDGVQVALGVTIYRTADVEDADVEGADDDTDEKRAAAAAEVALNKCPWL